MKTSAEIKELISGNERYRGFTVLDRPVPFRLLFHGQNIRYVQFHSLEPCGNDIVGFCGVCSWKDGEIKPEDGDTYSKNMLVYGYSWFTIEHDDLSIEAVDILVDEW